MKQSKFIISADPAPSDAADPEDDGAEAALDAGVDAGTGPGSELRVLAIGAAEHGERLDRALVALVPEFSRSYLQQLIDAGAVTLNGAVARKAAAKLKAGDKATIELRPTPQSQAFKPEAMDITVVHEDEHLLVIDKPAGLVVHPAPGNWSGTLLNGLLARDPAALSMPRAGIVHRLDKDTSGLMMVARTRPAMDALVNMIAAREVSRQYVALAHKPWTGPASRQVSEPIGRDPRNRLRMAAVDLARTPGKPAGTGIELIENAAQGCWVRCTLQTGRTHQIRVHMAFIGHPLVGDELYGGVVVAGMARQALHAERLAFRHPLTGRGMAFHAALPADLRLALTQWGLYNRA